MNIDTNFNHLEMAVLISEQNWSADATPLVSIINNTYNHENFIREALDGFLMQKTTFPVEILVHDDASTDRTAEIVREYELKYPGLVLPIYQTENQFSKGVKPTQNFQFPRARGKYIALCEGDDYWTDPLKLQKQVELMELYPQASMCVGLNEQLFINENKITEDSPYQSKEFPLITKLENLNQYFHTSTYLIRKSTLDFLRNDYRHLFTGDTSMRYLLISQGPFVVLNDHVSVYRITGKGTWTSLSDYEKELTNYKIFHSFRTKFINEQFYVHLENERNSLQRLINLCKVYNWRGKRNLFLIKYIFILGKYFPVVLMKKIVSKLIPHR